MNEISSMNKTVILEYGLFDLYFKLRNVSKSLRKRVAFVQEGLVFYRQFLKTATEPTRQIFRVQPNPEDAIIFEKGPEETKQNQGVESLKAVFTELGFSFPIEFSGPTGSHFKFVNSLYILEERIKMHIQQSSFILINHMKINKVIQKQFEALIPKIEKVRKLSLFYGTFSNLNLSVLKLEEAHFVVFEFEGTVVLPSSLKSLLVLGSKNFHFLKCSRVTELSLNVSPLKEKEIRWLKELKGVKKITLTVKNIPLDCIPRSVRELYIYPQISVNDRKLRELFPFLIKTNVTVGVSNSTKIREISGLLTNYTGFNTEVRRIVIRENNLELFLAKPALLALAKDISILKVNFPFEYLPSDLKKLRVETSKVDSELMTNWTTNIPKLKEADISLVAFDYPKTQDFKDKIKKMVDCLKTSGTLRVSGSIFSFLWKDYSFLKLIPNLNIL